MSDYVVKTLADARARAEELEESLRVVQAELGVVRDIERAAASLDGTSPSVAKPKAPEPASKPKPKAKPKRKPSAPPTQPKQVQMPVSERAEEVLAYISQHEGAKPREIRAGLGYSTESLQKALTVLMRDGKIKAEGVTNSRRYWTTAARDQAAAQTPDMRGHLGSALRARVLAAVAADPGALTEDRLAQALNADREHIAEVCGSLLEEDELRLARDGCWYPGVPDGAEPESAAA